MDFTAVEENGEIKVKCIVEKKGKDIIIHAPSFPLIEKLKKEFKEKQNGLRHI